MSRTPSNSIVFKRTPVARNEGAIQQQQLRGVGALHSRIFHAIHDEKIFLKKAEQMANFLEKQGVEKKQFL